MNERVARQKTLFTVPEAPDDAPALRCGRCACGRLFFPPHRFGCEACGAGPEAVSVVEIETAGTLLGVARVHGQNRPDGAGPLVVGRVLLDGGPSIAVMLDVHEDAGLEKGTRLRGTLVPAADDSEGRMVVDLLFRPEGGAS